jgi:hypothetical protein
MRLQAKSREESARTENGTGVIGRPGARREESAVAEQAARVLAEIAHHALRRKPSAP